MARSETHFYNSDNVEADPLDYQWRPGGQVPSTVYVEIDDAPDPATGKTGTKLLSCPTDEVAAHIVALHNENLGKP